MTKLVFPLNLLIERRPPKPFMVMPCLLFFLFFLETPSSSSSFGGSHTNTSDFSDFRSSRASFSEWWLMPSLTWSGAKKTHDPEVTFRFLYSIRNKLLWTFEIPDLPSIFKFMDDFVQWGWSFDTWKTLKMVWNPPTLHDQQRLEINVEGEPSSRGVIANFHRFLRVPQENCDCPGNIKDIKAT